MPLSLSAILVITMFTGCQNTTKTAAPSSETQVATTITPNDKDIVILFTNDVHCGVDGSTDRWKSTSVISHVSGINAVIDGHSHEVYTQNVIDKDGKQIILVQTGTKLKK